MSKTKIEWCDYTINPVRGLCPVDCIDNQGKPYCYARRMYKRFHLRPDGTINPTWDYTIRWNEQCLSDLREIKGSSRIFVGSTIELFGDWIPDNAITAILQYVCVYPQHTFIFLTKQPQNLPREFPNNCWVGLSVDGTLNAPLHRIYNYFDKVKATVKFLSFEPLLAQTKLDPRDLEWAGINWVIVGQCTPVKASTMPQISWVHDIVQAADKAGIPVFLKDNLLELVNYEGEGTDFAFNKDGEYRQEFPVIERRQGE